MPNNYLSVLYKHVIEVEIKNVGLKVGRAQTYHCLPPPPPSNQKSGGGAHAPLAPRFLRQCVCVYIYIYIYIYIYGEGVL